MIVDYSNLVQRQTLSTQFGIKTNNVRTDFDCGDRQTLIIWLKYTRSVGPGFMFI